MNKRRENLAGYAFISPALITFIILIAFPFFFSIFLSLTEWNFLSGIENIKFVGLKNFLKLASDKRFLFGVSNTFIYAITIVCIVCTVIAFVLYGLSKKVSICIAVHR